MKQREGNYMAANVSERMPRIVPMMAFEDVGGALDWLAAAFGFRERTRFEESDGRITHAEMEMEDGVIMLANPTPDYQSPRRHRESCQQARKWSEVPYVIDGLLVYVQDVDKHFAQARDAGATILSEPEDQSYGDRNYRAEDLEGHRWMFAQHLRDVPPGRMVNLPRSTGKYVRARRAGGSHGQPDQADAGRGGPAPEAAPVARRFLRGGQEVR
jgi:uncharacterized glyoxalase superfamily protein PhnB